MGLLDALDDLITGGASSNADEALRAAQGRFRGLNPPSLEEMKVELQNAVYAGDLTPEDAETILLQASAQEQVSTDPRLRQAQMAALEQLSGLAQNGGLSVGERGDLQRIAGETSALEKGQRDAILQNAQSRGVAGSGLELASQLQAQQGAANRASQMGFDVARQAQNRALEAMLQSGELGGQIRSQDFGEQSKLAEARDAIAKFNAQNKQAINLANVQARNEAQARNVNMAQDLANRKADTANQQNLYNAGNVKDLYTQQMQKAQGMAGVDQAMANNENAAGQRKQNLFGSILGAGALAYGAAK